jgi:glycosyltransferase involved in cell wall biosynthesis
MRILFLSHYYPPEVNAPATRTFDHCVRWVRAGHEVTVITCVPNCPDGVLFPGYKNRLFRQVEQMDGVRIVRVWTYLAPNAGTVRRIANYVVFMICAVFASVRIARPDVVVATSPQFFCGWAGVFVSWLKWRPLVLEIRDIWPESIKAVGAMRGGYLLRLLEKMERWMYRSAQHIVTVGNGYRDNILGKVDVQDRITVITNGVDLTQFVPDASYPDLKAKWGSESKFVCAYVGTLGMAHGLEVVIEAAQQLKALGREDIVFCLVGDGAERCALEEKAQAAGVSDLVIFTGRYPKEDIPTVLANCDACLIHLRGRELFGSVIPSKIFETMAMRRPIIMGVRGEALKIVLQAKAGIAMEPDSAESLVAAVTRLADDSAFRNQLGRSAREFVEEHYNRDNLANAYLDLLQATVEPKESPNEPESHLTHSKEVGSGASDL